MAFAAKSPLLDFVLTYLETTLASIDSRHSDDLVLQKTGPLAWTEAILAFLARYAVPPGTEGPDASFRPHAVWAEAQLEASGQKVSYVVDGTTYTGLILPYRAFGYHSYHQGRVRMYQDHLVEHQVQMFFFF